MEGLIKPARRLGWVLLATLASPAVGQTLAATYANVLRPRIAEAAVVENVAFDWDAYHFKLVRGSLALAAPIEGRVTAAVFLGQGELEVKPPTAIEQQQLSFFLGHGSIAEPFSQAVFRFADGERFLAALADQAHFHAVGPTAEFDKVVNERAQQQEQDSRIEGARLALSLQADPALPTAGELLYAELKTESHGWIEASDDPMQPEAIRVHARAQRGVPRPLGAVTAFDDTWTEFAPLKATAAAPPWRLADYRIALTVPRRLLDYTLHTRTFSFEAEATLTSAWDAGQLVLLRLDNRFRVAAITVAGAPAEFFQPAAAVEDDDMIGAKIQPEVGFEGAWLLLRLPHAMTVGEIAKIDVRYSVRPVNNRQTALFDQNRLWYPIAAFPARAGRTNFDLTITSDPDVMALGSGELVRDERVGEYRVTQWRTAQPCAGIGFWLRPGVVDQNRRPLTDAVPSAAGGDVAVTLEDLIPTADVRPAQFLGAHPAASPRVIDESGLPSTELENEPSGPKDPPLLRRIADAVRFCADMFGGNAGQELRMAEMRYSGIDLSTLNAELAPGGLHALPQSRGMPAWEAFSTLPMTSYNHPIVPSPAAVRTVELLPVQQVAEQWFGVNVGWAAPHDEWLGLGFAKAAALLFAGRVYADSPDAPGELEQWRMDLLHRDAYDQTPNELGPIWLGPRLDSSRDPLGEEIVVGEKGAYVLYMLRQMMSNPGDDEPDARFRAMMHEYTASWGGKDPTTADFIALATRYMSANMDVDGNRTLDWFFGQYVYGTLVPHLAYHTGIVIADDGTATVKASFDNPDHWRGVIPVYAVKSKDGKQYQRNWVRIAGPSVQAEWKVAFVPLAVVPNKFDDMLADLRARVDAKP